MQTGMKTMGWFFCVACMAFRQHEEIGLLSSFELGIVKTIRIQSQAGIQ